MVEISIIIPVYNSEKYIRQCIESVQKQSVKSIEIICVDDGSIDSTPDILEMLSARDQRIKVFRQKNAGAGQARNSGIEKAQGKYIAFLDADDYYINSESVQRMMRRCRQLQVRACGSIMSHCIGGTVKKAANSRQLTQFAQMGALSFVKYPLDYDFTTFIFERSLIEDSGARFPSCSFYEDPPFLTKVLFYAQRYAIEDIDFYCYRLGHKEERFTAPKCEGMLLGIKENLEFSAENNIEKLFAKTLSRLEYEYGERILKSLYTDRVDALQMLVEINQAVQKQPGYEKYIIRPLKKILEQIETMRNDYEYSLQNEIKGYGKIYIFGAGVTARQFLRYLKRLGMQEKVNGLLVTDKRGMPGGIDGIPIYSTSEFKASLPGGCIYIAVSGLFVAEVVEALDAENIRNYKILDTEILNGF